LKKLSDFYGNSIRLKNAGSVSDANAIKGRVGYFGEEEDENLYICECHRTALIKNFYTGDLCSAPASFAKHPTSEKRKSYRSVTYDLYNLCGIAKELKAIETPKKEAHVEMILHKVDGASQNMVPRAIGMLNPVASMDKPIQAKASTPSCDQPTHVVKKNSANTKSKVIAMKPASHCTNYNPR